MISLAQLWLPILLSTVVVFFASSVLHMALKFWHIPDYKGFSNEDEVRAAIRNGRPTTPGIYSLPLCNMETMNTPEMKRKFDEGPVGLMFLRPAGKMNMAAPMVQWFVFCLVVSLFAAYIAAVTLAASTDGMQVFRVVATVTFMAYSFGAIPDGIWLGQPWKSVFKHVVDGLVYALVTGALFGWLWPDATAV